MKKINLLFVLPAMLAAQTTLAQNSHLKLSSDYPEVAEKIRITYDPAGSPMAGLKDISATAFYDNDQKIPPAEDIDLKAKDGLLTGEFKIPPLTQAFFIKVYSGDSVDNNNGKGYLYMVYKNKKPVPGAYETQGGILWSSVGNYYAKIKQDEDAGLASYRKGIELYPNTERPGIVGYYCVLNTKKDPETVKFMSDKLARLLSSKNEKDLIMLRHIYEWNGDTQAIDSVNNIISKRFPDGEGSRRPLYIAAKQEANLAKKDSLYQIYNSKFPNEDDDDNLWGNDLRKDLALAHLWAGNSAAFDKYVAQIKDKDHIAGIYNFIARHYANRDSVLSLVELLSKKCLDITNENINNPKPAAFITVKQVVDAAKDVHDMYADTYAFILYKEKRYDEALQVLQPVYDRNRDDADINLHYVLILNALGKYAQSKAVIERAMKAGKGTKLLVLELKKAYVGINGNETSYDKYFAMANKEALMAKRANMLKEMISTPAPSFALKDFEGNTVSLSSLKGKVVVVDFWATWCGPCKASFPGMQLAVNKYKNDPDVKFLFIDTYESGDNFADGVKKFIADNKYTFHVLFDDKTESGNQAKVVTQFGVDAIPTKFIIDKDGIIRFKKVGSGETNAILDEVSEMVDLVKEPGLAQASVKQEMK